MSVEAERAEGRAGGGNVGGDNGEGGECWMQRRQRQQWRRSI